MRDRPLIVESHTRTVDICATQKPTRFLLELAVAVWNGEDSLLQKYLINQRARGALHTAAVCVECVRGGSELQM